jgi:hypothetical protein
MSKHVNMTGHYKIAGRERQGEDILQASQKSVYAQQRRQARVEAIESKDGKPAWETTPPNLDIPDRPKPRTRKSAKPNRKRAKTQKGRKSANTRTSARARKAAPRRKSGRSGSRSAR